MEQLEKRLKERCPALELRAKEPMAKHTTFRIGGPAALMALPRTGAEAKTAVQTARELGIVPFFLGNGSNLLAADEGYPGFVVKLTGDFEEIREVNRSLETGSAVLLPRLANALLGRGLTGLEFASGIPGSIGGAVTMNAGAYGGELGQVISSVSSAAFPPEEEVRMWKDSGFSYRHSRFQERDEFILRASFSLKPGDPAGIKAKMDDLARRRREKQPLELPSAGSTFKRPEGAYAAALIDQCGLKGLRVGGAQVSEKHAGFVINAGGATCADVLALIGEVQRIVKEKTGFILEPEVRVTGEN